MNKIFFSMLLLNFSYNLGCCYYTEVEKIEPSERQKLKEHKNYKIDIDNLAEKINNIFNEGFYKQASKLDPKNKEKFIAEYSKLIEMLKPFNTFFHDKRDKFKTDIAEFIVTHYLNRFVLSREENIAAKDNNYRIERIKELINESYNQI